jgi:LAO/AO transport system kinase
MVNAEKVLQGDVRASSRLMRLIDDADPAATALLRELFPRTGRARIIGITGSPGAGKSTLTDRLIGAWRAKGKSVGVVAVDPTSPFTGGAILGDRIRMQAHATDPGVFIRSLATRGSLGGLSRATSDVVRVMDAMGKDVILVETVGVGQDELDIAQLAHTTIVVLVPGMGDDIQAIKAGILEVADVFAVNKADRTVRELRGMLDLRGAEPRGPGAFHSIASGTAARAAEQRGWSPPIVKTVALRDEGTAELVEAVERHQGWLENSGALPARERSRARAEFLALLRDRLLKGALASLASLGTLEDIADRIARREQDPWELADTLSRQLRDNPIPEPSPT